MLHIVGKTDIGKVRTSNQDDFAFGMLKDGMAWVVVCDGMGGANGGSVASSTAVHVFEEEMHAAGAAADEAAARALLFAALQKANEAVYQKSLSAPALSGMGTTVVACLAGAGSVYVAHAGDSRAYLVGEQGAVRLTRDHSFVQELIDRGSITEEEARSHAQRNIITRALGVEQSLRADFAAHVFPAGSCILLCSDGLTNAVAESEMTRAVQQDKAAAAETLTALANRLGGADNITVVMITSDDDRE